MAALPASSADVLVQNTSESASVPSINDTFHGAGIAVLIKSLKSVETDAAFTTDAEGTKICLKLAKQLRTVIETQVDAQITDCCDWLLQQVQKILHKATAGSSLDQTILWSKFHQLRCSEDFNRKWKNLLLASNLIPSVIFYQTISTRFLDFVLKDSFPVSDAPSLHDDNNFEPLTYEEENAIRYVAGYVVKCLLKSSDEDTKIGLKDLIDDSCNEEPEVSEEWIGSVDRGGLVYINNQTYQFICAVEYVVRREMTVKKAHTMDEALKERIKRVIEDDDEVQFSWMMAAVEMCDVVAERVFNMIISKWITIRGFSFADSILEMYKLSGKHGTEKAKRLRHSVSQN